MRQIILFTLMLIACLPWLRPAAAEPQRFQNYFEAIPVFWSQLYPDGGETIYCGKPFGAHKGRSINIEHLFPMAWVKKKLDCPSRKQCRERSDLFNRIEADLHNLYPARQEINQARSSHSFGIIKGETRRFGRCDFEVDERRRRVEPRPAVRGNIARAMFYMHERYGLKIFRRQGDLLKRWNREDPPDAGERRRNDVIEGIQGSRNPYIDWPGKADRLRF